MALVITRRKGERIFVGDRITIGVGKVFPDGRVRLVLDAPRDIKIAREEIAGAKK